MSEPIYLGQIVRISNRLRKAFGGPVLGKVWVKREDNVLGVWLLYRHGDIQCAWIHRNYVETA